MKNIPKTPDEQYEDDLRAYMESTFNGEQIKEQMREAFRHLFEFGQVVFDHETGASAKTYEELKEKLNRGI